MKLWAIADLHLERRQNWDALEHLEPHGDDWLILAGDIASTPEKLDAALTILKTRFSRLFWTPGNHELWTNPANPSLKGEALYHRYVALCRDHGCFTPEDPFVVWPGESERLLIAPVFTLYDYSFRPDDVAEDEAVDWALEAGLLCVDEVRLDPSPYPNRTAWCHARVRWTEEKLNQTLMQDIDGTVIASHYPLRHQDVHLRRIPRFSIWCGTRRTERWPARYRARVCINGHLHVKTTDHDGGCRFEEVSLGYPGQWQVDFGLKPYLRLIADDGLPPASAAA